MSWQRAQASAGKHRSYALSTAIIAALALATAASLVAVAPPASLWHDSESQLLPTAAAMVDDLYLEKEGSAYAMQSAFHKPAERHLHPSTLSLSGYPTVGGGAAELIFTVTYDGDMRQDRDTEQGPAEPPVVRLDVTGSGHRDLYRVTNITSNIGTGAVDIFEPYDHESATINAELGNTYTVRAMVEFVAEGFIPVYALGLDGDIVTVNVAASELVSMPYYEYVATRQDYLDNELGMQALDPARASASALEKRRVVDPHAPHLPLSSPPLSRSLAEPALQRVFNANGTVMTEDIAGELVPVHGIRVCVYDGFSPLYYTFSHGTRLNTTAADPACSYTDTNGRYEILNINRDDPDDMTDADVFVSVDSYGYGGVFQLYGVFDEEFVVYYTDTDTELDYDGATLISNFNFRDNNPRDGDMAGAARIISAISDGMAFFEEHGQDPTNLTVIWDYASPSDDALYLRNLNSIWLLGNYSHDRHTILHEFGHHVHLTHDLKFNYDCRHHYIDEKYDEVCAWGEGWANLVPHLVDESAELSAGVDRLINIETGHDIYLDERGIYKFTTFEASGRPVGEKVEGSVAAAMWDMADNTTDINYDMSSSNQLVGIDDSSAGVDSLLGLFFAGSYSSFADFYDRWEIEMRSDSAEGIAILHGMSFSIPSNTSYYEFAGELGGVFEYGMSNPQSYVSRLLQFNPNYVAVSDDGSTVAITSVDGLGLQTVDARTGEHMGLYATDGYSHACTLEKNTSDCLNNDAARKVADLGPAGFSSMNGIGFGLNSSVVLVSDWYNGSIKIHGSDGRYLGRLGTLGNGSGEFLGPNGITFLADDATAAVSYVVNRSIQTFEIASDGTTQYDGQFESYNIMDNLPFAWQQLATGPNGTLYATGDARSTILSPISSAYIDARQPSTGGNAQPSIWIYPPPHDSSPVTRIDDPSLCRLGGIAVDQDDLVYVSDWAQGRVRVYDPNNLRGDVNYSSMQFGDRQMNVRGVQGNMNVCNLNTAEAYIDEFGSLGRFSWQLEKPLGIALGPPDSSTGDVRVYIADMDGVKMYEKDREIPSVESVWAHTADKTVVQGETIELAVNFTERVTVTGTPVLALETGVAGSSAAYVSGSGSRTLTFNYTVNASAAPSYIDYAGTDSLSLGGGDSAAKIVDGSGNVANLTLPERGTAGSLAANAALWIDASPTGRAPFSIAALATVEAVENRQVGFDVSTTGTPGSYSLIGAPADAAISSSGAFIALQAIVILPPASAPRRRAPGGSRPESPAPRGALEQARAASMHFK